MKKIFIIIICSFVLFSCDPIIKYDYFVDNKSDKELVFRYKHGYADAKDSLTICPSHEITLIETITMRGANPQDEGKDFLFPFDNLNLITLDSIQVSKNIKARENWNYSNEIEYFGIIKTGTNIYKIRIDNKDIVKN